jgi:hypothetical protein
MLLYEIENPEIAAVKLYLHWLSRPVALRCNRYFTMMHLRATFVTLCA